MSEHKILHGDQQRYMVLEGTVSGHGCCFRFTIIDSRFQSGPASFEIMAECSSLEAATLICDALNKADAQ